MFTPLRNDGGGKMFSKYHPFFLEESKLTAKIRKLVGLLVKFYHFL